MLELRIDYSAQHLLIIFTFPHSLMTLIWDYTLNWIKRTYYLKHTGLLVYF